MLNILIKNGIIVDGSGKERFKSNIGIEGEFIVEIGKLDSEKADVIIDAKEMLVAPGFIDIHTHADTILLHFPNAESHIYQGVTTMIGGNCGYSAAPLRDWWLRDEWQYDWWHKIEPYKWYRQIMHPLDKVNEWMSKIYGWTIDWKSLDDYLKRLEEKGISVNYATYVGHNTVRAGVMGLDYARKAREEETNEMKKLVREAMKDGAFGFSTGLLYEPGRYGDIDELKTLAAIAKEYGGIYASHLREFSKGPPTGERYKGLIEALEIGKSLGIPVQLSHISACCDIYPSKYGDALSEALAIETLKLIENARKEGIDAMFDVLPDTTGAQVISPYIKSLFSPYIIEYGSTECLRDALRIKEVREEIIDDCESGKNPEWDAMNEPYWADKIKIVKSKIGKFQGKYIAEIAEAEGKNPFDIVFDIFIRDENAIIKPIEYQREAELIKFLTHHLCMIGSDGYALNDTWRINYPPYFLPHMNTYGAFTRVLTEYVREKQVLTLEEAIRKFTSLQAQRLRLKNRGLVKTGNYADITIFDLEKVAYKGDVSEPRKYSEGVEYVIVNGKIVLYKGKHTGTRPGKALRRASP